MAFLTPKTFSPNIFTVLESDYMFQFRYMLYIFYPLFDRVNTASLNTTTALLDKSKILAFIFECCIMKRLPAVGLVEMIDQSAAEFC